MADEIIDTPPSGRKWLRKIIIGACLLWVAFLAYFGIASMIGFNRVSESMEAEQAQVRAEELGETGGGFERTAPPAPTAAKSHRLVLPAGMPLPGDGVRYVVLETNQPQGQSALAVTLAELIERREINAAVQCYGDKLQMAFHEVDDYERFRAIELGAYQIIEVQASPIDLGATEIGCN